MLIDLTLRRAIARTKEAMEEDKLIAVLNEYLNVKIRRRYGTFMGLPGFQVGIKIGAAKELDEAWRHTVSQTTGLELPVLFFKIPRGECRAMLSLSTLTGGTKAEDMDYTIETSITGFAVIYQQIYDHRMLAVMDEKRHLIRNGIPLQ